MTASAPADGWFRERGEATGDVFFLLRTQPELRMEFVSDTIEGHLGHPSGDFLADPGLLARLVSPKDAARFEYMLSLPPGTIEHLELRWIHRDGHPVWTQTVVNCLRRDDGSVVLEGSSHSITTLRETQQRLAESEARYRLLAENAYDVIWTMALDGTITYVSPSVERVRGITPAEAASQPLDQIHPPESAARVTAYYAQLFEAIQNGTDLPTFHGEQEYYRKDGSIMLGELQVVPQVDDEGTVLSVLGVTRDISEQRRFETELEQLAVTDPLTGVWNRRQGEKLFTADLVEARRYGPALSLLMLDIDHFKDINDAYGHQVGDRVLVDLTRRLAENVRASDTLARWGGEEFVIVMRHCTIAEAVQFGGKVRALVADAPFGEVGLVTVSVGVAELRPSDDLASWLERADLALYEAKAAGRNAVVAAGHE